MIAIEFKVRKMGWAILFATVLVHLSASSVSAKNIFDWRMVMYSGVPIANQAGMAKSLVLMDRMVDLGYNGLYVTSSWMQKLHKPNVIQNKPNLKEFLAQAKKRSLAVIPLSQTQAGSPYQDQNLREALPTRGTPFIVSGGIARVKDDPSFGLNNGDFEDPLMGTWGNANSFARIVESRPGSEGTYCARLDDPTRPGRRLTQRIAVVPFRTYELSAWAKAVVGKIIKGEDPEEGIYFTVRANQPNLLLKDKYFKGGINLNGTWGRITQKFNSLGNSSVEISLQATNSCLFEGTVWLDDAKIREVGLYETSQNPGFSVVVRTADGDTLTEGKDYTVGAEQLTIPSSSSAKEGDELVVDWGATANMIHVVPEASFCHDDVWNGVRQQIQLQDDWFDFPPARMMGYSEWRLAGYDPKCIIEHHIGTWGSGPYMAYVANQTAQILREANSNRTLLLFSDNYNEHHNCGPKFAVTNGGNQGSGHFLDTNIIIVNWNADKGRALTSIRFFAGLDPTPWGKFGKKTSRHKQILSCNWGGIPVWLAALDSLEKSENLPDSSVIGIGYQNFLKGIDTLISHIDILKDACVEAGRWAGKPIIEFPPASTNERSKPGATAFANLTEVGNPLASLRVFQFSLSQRSDVELAVFDLHGKRVAVLLNEQMASNTYERDLDVSRLAPGMYFVSLRARGAQIQRITKKLVVL